MSNALDLLKTRATMGGDGESTGKKKRAAKKEGAASTSSNKAKKKKETVSDEQPVSPTTESVEISAYSDDELGNGSAENNGPGFEENGESINTLMEVPDQKITPGEMAAEKTEKRTQDKGSVSDRAKKEQVSDGEQSVSTATGSVGLSADLGDGLTDGSAENNSPVFEEDDESLNTLIEGPYKKIPSEEIAAEKASESIKVTRCFTVSKDVIDKLNFITGMSKIDNMNFSASAYVSKLIESDIDNKLKELGLLEMYNIRKKS